MRRRTNRAIPSNSRERNPSAPPPELPRDGVGGGGGGGAGESSSTMVTVARKVDPRAAPLDGFERVTVRASLFSSVLSFVRLTVMVLTPVSPSAQVRVPLALAVNCKVPELPRRNAQRRGDVLLGLPHRQAITLEHRGPIDAEGRELRMGPESRPWPAPMSGRPGG